MSEVGRRGVVHRAGRARRRRRSRPSRRWSSRPIGEDGCILYALHRGNDDPRRLAFVERWESKELLGAHLESDHVKAVLAKADDLFETGDIVVYDAMPGGEHARARSRRTPAADTSAERAASAGAPPSFDAPRARGGTAR